MKRFLCILFCLCGFPSIAVSQFTFTPIGDGSTYVCANDPDTGNLLGRLISDTEAVEVSFRRIIRKTRRQLRRARRKLRRGERRGVSENRLAALRARVAVLEDTASDLVDCRDETGDFGSGGGPVPTPGPTDAPCSVVGGTSGVTARIINGSACPVGNSPVVELFMLDVGGDIFGACTGTVVAPRVIISAAHCFPLGTTGAIVVTGSGSLNASSFHVHPGYSEAPGSIFEENDVAVVLVNQDLPTRVSGILSSNNFSLGEAAIIGGYGLDEFGGSGTLRAAPTVIARFSAISVTITYSGSGTFGNTCSGDSGGPIFVNRGGSWVLGGVTSNGLLENCGPGDTSNFANITDPVNQNFFNSIVPGLIP